MRSPLLHAGLRPTPFTSIASTSHLLPAARNPVADQTKIHPLEGRDYDAAELEVLYRESRSLVLGVMLVSRHFKPLTLLQFCEKVMVDEDKLPGQKICVFFSMVQS
ncbi:hypothetical protein ZWY2020_058368 [Hordeum vulgare]|nr:hypothetical protein ZWY2020_058368 [Hordeum vulgare]